MKLSTTQKFIRKIGRKTNAVLKDYFAPFLVCDDHGTMIQCWTMASAEKWLKYCSGRAWLLGTYDYNVIAYRERATLSRSVVKMAGM